MTGLGGRLHISSFVIEDLSDLGNIERIGESLSITSSPLVTGLDALGNLQSLSGLFLDNNAQLSDLGALSPITALVGGLAIRCHPLLGDLGGLHNIESIGGILSIEANDLLENLDDLSNLRKVEFGLNIMNNRALENIDGLESLESIDDCLGCPVDISGNDVLKNIDGLENINRIVGDLRISNNRALKNVDGLENLIDIFGRLLIVNNPALTNLNGLRRPESVTAVDVINNASLPQRLAVAFFDGLSESEDEFSVFGQIFGNRPDPTMEFEIVPAEEAIQIQTRLITVDDGPSDLLLAPLVLTAPLIEVPPDLVLGSIVWDADIPAGTRIQVRTRSGSALFVEEVLYFDRNGERITPERWEKTLSFLRGDRVEITRLEGDNWSPWSERNSFSGEAFRSPTGQVVEVEIALFSQEPGLVPTLRSFTLAENPPTAIVESRDSALPRVLALEQNYPNPFNSTTVMSIALPTAADVELAIFNAAGQQVAVLAQG